METKIYCFSATGNSLSVAQKIADGLGQTEIVSIAKEMKQPKMPNEPRIGLIFPVYVYGMPRIVREFLEMLDLSRTQYLFAVATCGGTPGATLQELKKFLKKRDVSLHSGFVVRYQSGNLAMGNPLISLIRSIAGKPPKSIDEQFNEIIAFIRNCQKSLFEKSALGANILGSALHAITCDILKNADKSFWVDGNCNLCGICTRICPRENLKIDKDTLRWNHNCEQCFACVHWCPQKAIQIGNTTIGKKRYHNSEVTINQFILR